MRIAVLAGGKATRHPNKLLLPTKEGIPVLIKVVRQALEVSRDVRVVVPDDGGLLRKIVIDLCPEIKYHGSFVTQPESRPGVCEAMILGAENYEGDLFAFLCGDNVYTNLRGKLTIQDGQRSIVHTRYAKGDLLRTKDGHYFRSMDEELKAIVTPWLFTRSSFMVGSCLLEGDSTNNFFENLNPDQIYVSQFEEWFDVGTPQGYKDYWRV